MKTKYVVLLSILFMGLNSVVAETLVELVNNELPVMSQTEKKMFDQLPEVAKQSLLARKNSGNDWTKGKEHLMYKKAFVNASDDKQKDETQTDKTISGNYVTVGSFAICNFSNIQDAVDASSSGDTIRVTGEIYTADDATFNINNKSLAIIGGFNHCGTSAVVTGKTTLNGFGMSFPDSIIELVDTNGGMSVNLFNIFLYGGQDDFDDGGGIEVTGVDVFQNLERIDLYVYNSNIFLNTSGNGGGLHATDANITISASTRIQANSAVSNGGGIYCKNGNISIEKDSLVGMSEGILGNDADSDSNGVGNGGGLYLDNCGLDLDASDGVTGAYVIGNSTGGSGGGISAKGGSVINLFGDKAWVNLNQAVFDGGGIFSEFTRINSFNGSINGNRARDGAGIKITDEILVMKRDANYPCHGKCNQLSENFAENSGGALHISTATVTLDGLWVENNTAAGHGFAFLSYLSTVDIENSMILNNVTNNAGAGFAPIELQGSTGIFNLGLSTLAKNAINIGTYLIDFNDSSGVHVNLDSNIFYTNDNLKFVLDTTTSADIEMENNVVENYLPLPGNNLLTVADFLSVATNNFHISTTSPAVDYGSNRLSILYDIDYEPRGLQQTPDAGADEANLKVGIAGSVCEYASISEAIVNANDGDTLYISAGNYIENPGVLNKSLTLLQANSTCTSAQSNSNNADVIIDGSNSFSSSGGVFNLASGETLTLKNITIQNAKANSGGIIYAAINSTLVLDNVVIKGGSAKRFGGGVFSHGSVELINGSKVYNNMATSTTGSDPQNGGGIAITANGILVLEDDSIVSDNSAVGKGGGIFTEGSVSLMDSSRVFANTANIGGGIYLNFTTLTLTNTSAIGEDGFGNHATLTGGGVHSENSTVHLFNNSIINDNSAINGGGLYLINDSVLIMQITSQVRDNTAIRGAGLYYIATAEDSYITNGQFIGNIASADGGGIYLTLDNEDSDVHVNNLILNSNQANIGGGLYYHSNDLSSHLYSSNANVTNNTANTKGGGMFLDNGSAGFTFSNLTNVIIANNNANDGAGVYLISDLDLISSNLIITDSFVKNNAAGSNGGAFFIDGALLRVERTELSLNSAVTGSVLKSITATSRFKNVVMYANTGFELFDIEDGYVFDIYDSTIIAEASTNVFNFNSNPSNSKIQNTILSGFAITTMPFGSLFVDCVLDSTGALGSTQSPLFINAALHDYHLQASSNAINKCTTGESLDYESNPRPVGNGPTPYDIGAFEYQSIVDDDLIFANGFD